MMMLNAGLRRASVASLWSAVMVESVDIVPVFCSFNLAQECLCPLQVQTRVLPCKETYYRCCTAKHPTFWPAVRLRKKPQVCGGESRSKRSQYQLWHGRRNWQRSPAP